MRPAGEAATHPAPENPSHPRRDRQSIPASRAESPRKAPTPGRPAHGSQPPPPATAALTAVAQQPRNRATSTAQPTGTAKGGRRSPPGPRRRRRRRATVLARRTTRRAKVATAQCANPRSQVTDFFCAFRTREPPVGPLPRVHTATAHEAPARQCHPVNLGPGPGAAFRLSRRHRRPEASRRRAVARRDVRAERAPRRRRRGHGSFYQSRRYI